MFENEKKSIANELKMKINHASVPCWQSSKFILSLIKFVHCSHVVVQIKVD